VSLQLKTSLKLSQSLVMTPQLQLSLKLLAMGRLELEETLQAELAENPVLEEHPEELIPSEPSKETEWEPNVERPSIDQTLSRSETLEEHLLWQVQMNDFNVLEREIAERLIGEMNDKGYLDIEPIDEHFELIGHIEDKPTTLERLRALKFPTHQAQPIVLLELIAQTLMVPIEWVESVRKRIMKLEPLGSLAIDAKECLLVQLEALGFDDETIEYNVVQHYLPNIEKRDYRVILRSLKIDLSDLAGAIKVIEKLEPIPARAYRTMSAGQLSSSIPDVFVIKTSEDYVVLTNQDGLPRLKLSQFYIDQLKSKKADESKTFIKEKLRSATWLIRSIHQRQKTICRVVEAIVEHQREWFDGTAPLKPLVLKTIADEIGVHESTVSRVTNDKYVHTDRGVFELKHFFSSTLQNTDGSSTSSEAVREAIRKLIASENPKHPLSDLDVVETLKSQNIQVARRTVAKYREAMGILPSSKRRESLLEQQSPL
jgi:RNA polymerase sigma-54 factor